MRKFIAIGVNLIKGINKCDTVGLGIPYHLIAQSLKQVEFYRRRRPEIFPALPQFKEQVLNAILDKSFVGYHLIPVGQQVFCMCAIDFFESTSIPFFKGLPQFIRLCGVFSFHEWP